MEFKLEDLPKQANAKVNEMNEWWPALEDRIKHAIPHLLAEKNIDDSIGVSIKSNFNSFMKLLGPKTT